ncbi:mitochondrial carrier domain-containing protein [Dichotomocladium elegans]|nr:mitochondrial carrier domain-containing protein [Dichotomocladium elegans]
MAMRDYLPGDQPPYNPLRPYYTPGLIQQHNYTSLPSSDAIPGHTPELFDVDNRSPLKSTTTKFTTYAGFKYFRTMCTSPFEVGTTLLQVQYTPHESIEVFGFRDPQSLSGSSMSALYETGAPSSSDDDEDGFFSGSAQQRQTDVSSIHSCSRRTRTIPVMNGGVLDILSRIVRQPTEGWRSLFKGQRATWIHGLLWDLLQPALEGLLNDFFGLYDDTIPLTHLDRIVPNLSTLVASHIVVGLLLAPLETIRTRLIVQSSAPHVAKYKGIYHAFKTICREEGGIRSLYVSSLTPTILYYTARPLISSSIPIVIDRTLGISAPDSPVLYSAAEFSLRTLGLLITLPLETIRKRIQCQARAKDNRIIFETAVVVRPVPYKGFFDALYKIMKEEGSSRPMNARATLPVDPSNSSDSEEDDFLPSAPPPPSQKRASDSAWGIRGLYKGFAMQLVLNGMMFVFQAVNGIDEEDLSALA